MKEHTSKGKKLKIHMINKNEWYGGNEFPGMCNNVYGLVSDDWMTDCNKEVTCKKCKMNMKIHAIR